MRTDVKHDHDLVDDLFCCESWFHSI